MLIWKILKNYNKNWQDGKRSIMKDNSFGGRARLSK